MTSITKLFWNNLQRSKSGNKLVLVYSGGKVKRVAGKFLNDLFDCFRTTCLTVLECKF